MDIEQRRTLAKKLAAADYSLNRAQRAHEGGHRDVAFHDTMYALRQMHEALDALIIEPSIPAQEPSSGYDLRHMQDAASAKLGVKSR